jgi:uncharacterized short protein YbdD (DUF466 family)
MSRPSSRPETEAHGGKRDRAAPLGIRLTRVLRRIVGAPDYDAYLAHCRAAGHEPRLSEREYVAEFFESKGRGVRCC